MPRPPATFSPLTTRKSGSRRSRSAGSMPRSVRLPSPPTRSPANRMLMARGIQRLTPPALIITGMRRWARLRTPDPPQPDGEPDPEAVQAGGPAEAEGLDEGAVAAAQHGPQRAPDAPEDPDDPDRPPDRTGPPLRELAVAPVVVPR